MISSGIQNRKYKGSSVEQSSMLWFQFGKFVLENETVPGSESCDLASFAQTCASAPSVARPSSGRGRRRSVFRSSPCRSSHPPPTVTKKTTSTLWPEMGEHFLVVRKKLVHLTFWASSCLSKLTNPKPRDFPLSSVMTRILMEFPRKRRDPTSLLIPLIFYFRGSKKLYMPVQEQTHFKKLLTIFNEELPQALLIHIVTKVFNVDVCKLLGSGTKLSLAFFARFEATDESALKSTFSQIKMHKRNKMFWPSQLKIQLLSRPWVSLMSSSLLDVL